MERRKMDFDEKLIQEVRKYQLLYNPALEDYKSLRKKERAWLAVSRSVNLNVTLCRKRWKGLRDCYMRCRRNSATGVKQKWKYYQPMSFLDNITSYKRSIWNPPQYESNDKETDKSYENDENTMQAKEDESAVKALDEYIENHGGDHMEYIATEEYALPRVESPPMLELENNAREISFEEQLIEEVRQQSCLYDSHDYEHTKAKDRIWIDISERLNSSDDVCKAVWKTLRDSYTKILERMNLRSGTASKRKNKWKYFEKMKFLDDYINSRIGVIKTIDKTEAADDYFDTVPEVPEERTLNSDDLELPAGFAQSLDPLDQSTSSECTSKSEHKRKADAQQSLLKDSTTLLFESLNQNIKDAKLNAKQRLDMESSIAALVYAKLLSYSN